MNINNIINRIKEFIKLEIKKKYFKYFAITIITFILSRIFYYSYLGIKFDVSTLSWYWQYIDPYLLQTKLLESIFYLYSQPPLFNLFLGVILKLFPNYYPFVFNTIYFILGIIMSYSILLIMINLGISYKISAILTNIFIICPSTVLYENWLFYTYPLTVLLCLSLVFLLRYLKNNRFKDALFFFLIIASIMLMRNLFHIVWIFAITGILILIKRYNWKTIILASFLPIILVLFIYIKNFCIFGTYTTGASYIGRNLEEMITFSLPFEERKSLVEQGKLSGLSLISIFTLDVSNYKPYLEKKEKTGIPVLDIEYKSGGYPNLHNILFLEISKYYLKDVKYVMKTYPIRSFKVIMNYFKRYFFPVSNIVPFPGDDQAGDIIPFSVSNENYKKMDKLITFFNIIILGQRSYNEIAIFILISIPFLVFYAFYLIYKLLLKGDKDIPLVGILLFILLTIALVTAASIITWENPRFRFLINPFYLILFGLFLNQILKNVFFYLILFGSFLNQILKNVFSKILNIKIDLFLIFFLILVIVSIFLLFYVPNALNKKFDHDEFQHVHIGWSLKEGNVLYKDTFDHHGPIYAFLISILWRVFNFDDNSSTLIKLRVISLILLLILLTVIFLTVRKIFNSLIGLLVLIIILSNKIIYIKGIEIRPDLLQSILFSLGYYFLIANIINRDKKYCYYLTGFFWGLTILTNFKAIIIIGACLLVYIIIYFKEIKIINIIEGINGMLISVIPIFLFFYINNAINEFIYYNYTFNIIAFFIQSKSVMKAFIKSNIGFYITWIGLYLTGGFYLLKIEKGIDKKLKYFLLLFSIYLILLTRLNFYEQWKLSLIPILSIIPGYGLYSIFRTKIKYYVNQIFGISIIIYLVMLLFFYKDTYTILNKRNISKRKNFENTYYLGSNTEQIQFTNYVNYITSKNNKIFIIWNNYGGYIYRPHLLFYWFINENQEMIIDRILGFKLLGDNLIYKLEKEKCKYLIIGQEMNWLKAKYYKSYKYILDKYEKDIIYPYLWIRK